MFARWLVLAVVAGAIPPTYAAAPENSTPGSGKHAFLLGCNYSGKELKAIANAQGDLTAVKAALAASGFANENVVFLAEGLEPRYRADSIHIRQELKRVLDNLEPADLIVVALVGHAIQYPDDPRCYFCPSDGRLDDRSSLVSFQEVYQLLDRCRAGRKLVLADLYHGDARANGSRASRQPVEPAIKLQTEPLPRGVVALFSCTEDQRSQVRKEDGQGVFFHFVTKGWQGEAGTSGPVTVDLLFRYVREETLKYSKTKLEATQAPVRRGDVASNFALNDKPARKIATEVRRDPPKTPERKYGLSLKVRRQQERDIAQATRRLGVEAYPDRSGGALLFLSQTGALAIAPGRDAASGLDDPTATYRYGLKLKARKAGEADFSDETRTWTVEAYRDDNARATIYVADSGAVAVVPGRAEADPEVGAKPKPALWKHVLELKSRKRGAGRFTEQTAKFGVEIYQDGNNGNLIFLTETGSLAVVPAPKPAGETNEPNFSHRIDVALRKSALPVETASRRINIEAYLESFSRNLVFLTEDGFIAVGKPQGNSGDDDDDQKKVVWQRSLDLKARKPGEEELTASSRRFGIEVFREPKSGLQLYVSESGAIAVGIAGPPK